jgi:hypothetical protein
MPVGAAIEQLFDIAQDPGAKRRFISGRFNLIQCPSCGYQGQVATPILYHDPDRELLMSYVPMELALPQPEQERIIGKLMNEVINRLPQEKRKGYLLNPKAALTLQGMLDRVLEGEGVTREMLEAQKAKVQLVQQLLTTPEDQLPALVREHDAKLDEVFFELLGASIATQAAQGGQAAAQHLLDLRNRLLDLSSYGAQAKQRQQVYEAVAQELDALAKDKKFTPDKLLELIIKARDEDRVAAYVSFARPALDYAFFEALTRRIDKAEGAEKERLSKLRDTLLELTQAIDQAAQAHVAEATELLRTLLDAPNPDEALRANLPRIDETFMNVLSTNLDAARRSGRMDVVQRLNQINEAVARLVREAAPPEIRFINELLEIESDAEVEAALKRRAAEVSQAVIDAMTYIAENLRQNGQVQVADRLEKLRQMALGELMAANWKK